MDVPAAWDQQTTSTAGSRSATEVGVWLLKIVVSLATGITQVQLPFFDRNNPKSRLEYKSKDGCISFGHDCTMKLGHG